MFVFFTISATATLISLLYGLYNAYKMKGSDNKEERALRVGTAAAIFCSCILFAAISFMGVMRDYNQSKVDEWTNHGYEIIARYGSFSTKSYPNDAPCSDGSDVVFLTGSGEVTTLKSASYAICK